MGKAIRLASNFVVLDDEFKANVVALTPDIHKRIDEEFKDFAGHLLISSYAFDEDWPTWEVHPAGDEFVILVAGDATPGTPRAFASRRSCCSLRQERVRSMPGSRRVGESNPMKLLEKKISSRSRTRVFSRTDITQSAANLVPC